MPESSAGEADVAQRAPVEHQAGAAWPAIPRRGVRPPVELKKCCGFLELEVDHVIGCEKLFVVPCAIATPLVLRSAFARWTECALGNRGKQRIWLNSY